MPKPRKRLPGHAHGVLLWPKHNERSLLFENLQHSFKQAKALRWRPLFPLVDVHWFYRCDEHGPAAGLIRFQPGGRVPLHEHCGFEHIYVLSGSQTDENGRLPAGGFMVHAPGTRHSILSEEGCLVLAIYEKRARFLQAPGL